MSSYCKHIHTKIKYIFFQFCRIQLNSSPKGLEYVRKSYVIKLTSKSLSTGLWMLIMLFKLPRFFGTGHGSLLSSVSQVMSLYLKSAQHQWEQEMEGGMVCVTRHWNAEMTSSLSMQETRKEEALPELTSWPPMYMSYIHNEMLLLCKRHWQWWQLCLPVMYMPERVLNTMGSICHITHTTTLWSGNFSHLRAIRSPSQTLLL